jgi:choline dehydrogenase-like flavoprotein
LCIVGAGPVGLALAIACERLGLDTLVLESGQSEIYPKPTKDSDALIVDQEHHDPMEMTVRRALGGGSWLWAGRCVPFDPIDFIPRDFVPGSDWPIRYEDVQPWYRSACEYLQAGDTFQIPFKRELGSGLTVDFLEHWTIEPHVAVLYRERLQNSERIKICLRTTVIDLDLGEEGRWVQALVVATDKGKVRVKARRVVLATGGVEATRLLLAVQRNWPDHFGGTDGPLGRYYMGHLAGTIANLVFDDPRSSTDYEFFRDASGAYARRRFMLTWETQLKNKVLNTAFWLANPQLNDSRHKSGILSALFLLGKRLRSEPLEVREIEIRSKPYQVGAHLLNIVKDSPCLVRDTFLILYDEMFNKPKLPAYTIRNRGGRVKLRYHGEQVPNSHNRITLTDELDRHGLPRVAVDFRFTDQDVRSVVDSHYLLDASLQANGIGHLELRYPSDQLYDGVLEQSIDGHHQVGTTRMGDDPRDSVVDQNLQVHGVDNLSIVSTSVYRTDGQASSTLLAVALAMRLASHLAGATKNPLISERAWPCEPCGTFPSAEPTRPGIGTEDRTG